MTLALPSSRRRRRPLRIATLLVTTLIVGSAAHDLWAAPRFWSVTPYDVRIIVAAVGPRLNHPAYASSFDRELREQLSRGVRPLWRESLEYAPAEERSDLVAGIAEPTPPDAPDAPDSTDDARQPDKTILIAVRETGEGITVVAREHDAALDRWGAPHQSRVARLADTPEAIVDAAVAAFAPLASFEIDPQAPTRVILAYRGAELTREEFGEITAGEILLPYLRRVDREGAPVPGGVRRVNWTYLVAEDAAGGPETSARVYSHARTPFGARRRGRIQQLALHVRRDREAATSLRLHDRNDPAVPLAGYEVFASPPGTKDLTRLGRSDASGRVAVPPDAEGGPVRMVHIRCGSSVVASLPIAVGVERLLQTPLLDERKRLAAETKVAAIREELVDLVAQRRILAARIRKRIAAEDLDAADDLLAQVNALPGPAHFNDRLRKAEQLYRANDPVAQRRLERLFSETRSVLGSALDARETRQLANEVLEAKRSGG